MFFTEARVSDVISQCLVTTYLAATPTTVLAVTRSLPVAICLRAAMKRAEIQVPWVRVPCLFHPMIVAMWNNARV